MDGIRWIVEDALKFVRREARRGRRYDGIVLDPPAYGRGAAGEKWVLEEHINEMLSLCGELLSARASACTQACGSETGGSGTAETAVICREGMCRNAGGQSCDDYVFYVPTTTGPCMYAVRFGRTLSERSLDRSIRSRGNRNRHRYYGVYN